MYRLLFVLVIGVALSSINVRGNVLPREWPPNAFDYLRGTWDEPLSVSDYRCQIDGSSVRAIIGYAQLPSYRGQRHDRERWIDSEGYERSTTFLTLRVGLMSVAEFGLRVPVARISLKSSSQQSEHSGLSDILATLRVPVYRRQDDSAQISLGVGFKVASGEWKDTELPTSTASNDLVFNGYASVYSGRVHLLAHIGMARAVVQHDDESDALKHAYTYEFLVGSELVPKTKAYIGISGYEHTSDSGQTSNKVSFVPRLTVMLGKKLHELELGCCVDIDSMRSLSGMQVYIGYAIGFD